MSSTSAAQSFEGSDLIETRHIPVTDNLRRYPADLQPWGAHASGMVVLEDGTVIVGWYGGTCGVVNKYGAYTEDPRGASRIYVAKLTPKSDHFSEPQLIAGDGKTRYMDANLYVDREKIWAFYVRDGGSQDTIVYKTTQDPSLKDWSDEMPVAIHHLGRIMNPPIQHNDSLIVPISAFDKKNGPWRDVVVASTDNSGADWRFLSRIESQDQQLILREPCLVSFPDELQMYARVSVVDADWGRVSPEDPRWAVHRSISRDGGSTWSAPTKVNVPNYDSKVSVVRLGDGRLVMAYNPKPERFPLTIAISTDRGATWTEHGTIDPGPGEMSYPTLYVDHEQRLHVSYTWKRREIHYKQYVLA